MLIQLVQTKIGIDQLVYNAIKLSSSRGMHQCSKQDIRSLSPTEDCCIFRVNTIRHEECIDARNKTAQEHYGRKMTMFLGRTTKLYDPKNLTSDLQELGRNQDLLFTQKQLVLSTMTRKDLAQLANWGWMPQEC
jgi:hypothetical protein